MLKRSQIEHKPMYIDNIISATNRKDVSNYSIQS